jgi:hypothetical protein
MFAWVRVVVAMVQHIPIRRVHLMTQQERVKMMKAMEEILENCRRLEEKVDQVVLKSIAQPAKMRESESNGA